MQTMILSIDIGVVVCSSSNGNDLVKVYFSVFYYLKIDIMHFSVFNYLAKLINYLKYVYF